MTKQIIFIFGILGSVLLSMAGLRSVYANPEIQVIEGKLGTKDSITIKGLSNSDFTFVGKSSAESYIPDQTQIVPTDQNPIVWTEWDAGGVKIGRVFNLNCRSHGTDPLRPSELVFEGQSAGFISKEELGLDGLTPRAWIVSTVYYKLDGGDSEGSEPRTDRTHVSLAVNACEFVKPANALPLSAPND
jgi:hypothetical protein